MLILIVLIIWIIGWVFSIYPIYTNIIKTHQEHLYNRAKHEPLQRSDLARAMMGATGIGMIWFLALPVFISIVIHKRGTPDLSTDADNFIEEFKQRIDLKEALAKHRRELEEKSRSHKDSPSDYDERWPPPKRR